MEYIQLMYVFLFAVVGFYGTKGEFTSWKEPPIDSGIGEGNASVVVKENGLPGTRTGIKLQALGGTGNISYVLKQQNPLYFSIGGPAGDEVTIASPVDYEQLTEVTVTVIAVDHGSPQMTGSAKMTIFIGDVNDNRPVFQKNLYTVTLPELTDTGYVTEKNSCLC